MKQIPDFPHYSITEDGRVWSNERIVIRSDGVPQRRKGKWLKPVVDKGYHIVNLYDGPTRKKRFVHQLVALNYLAPVEGKDCVNHIDGNKTNNTVDNLEWCTPTENNLHRTNVLRKCLGEENGLSKLTDQEVIEMRRLRATGMSCPKIAKMFGIADSVSWKICTNKMWKHI